MIRKMFLFWGASDEDETTDGDETTGTDDDQNPTSHPSTKTLTADELTAMTAKAADRASRKARKDLADKFGFDNLSSFEEWVESQRKAEKDAMDEQERAIAEAREAKAAADALRSNLASDRLDVAIERHVVAEGVTDKKKLDRITALVRLDLEPDVINEEDNWEEAITAALSDVKSDTPELFGRAKGFGSGDGGARGDSTKEEDKEAERIKKYEEQFAAKGLITYDPDSF